MKRSRIAMGAIAAGAAAALLLALPSRGTATMSIPSGPKSDIGRGEQLIVLVAGTYPSQAAAEAANAAMHFGDIQGFIVAPTGDFLSMTAGRWALVSAFRTGTGVEAFEPIARAAGATSLTRVVTVYAGSQWIGLGQEERPDGTGPLVHSLP